MTAAARLPATCRATSERSSATWDRCSLDRLQLSAMRTMGLKWLDGVPSAGPPSLRKLGLAIIAAALLGPALGPLGVPAAAGASAPSWQVVKGFAPPLDSSNAVACVMTSVCFVLGAQNIPGSFG